MRGRDEVESCLSGFNLMTLASSARHDPRGDGFHVEL